VGNLTGMHDIDKLFFDTMAGVLVILAIGLIPK
jgi:hypothetical protein